jgi:predicted methyltransferase
VITRALLLLLLCTLACSPRKTASVATPPTEPAATEVRASTRTPSAAQRAIVAASDRLPDDTALDQGRKPAELLAFLDLQPGMRAADLIAGYGYTTELMARAVGPQGKVYAQNNRFVREKFLEPAWTERLALPQMANVQRLDTELDAPFPRGVHELDMVTMVLFYHDTYWQGVDRKAMNAAIFAALRPGGSYVVIDHSAREGDGAGAVQSLHRVEESLVRREIEAAGFRLVETADFLRNPADTRDWDASPRAAHEAGKRGASDRFALRFVKPPA